MSHTDKLISVIIPCRNEIRYIQDCIEALLQQEGISQQQIEIIIVDGQSTDGSAEYVKDRFGDQVTLLHNEKLFTPFAFNLGIKHASGRYISIVGARSALSKNYLSTAIETLENKPEVACVGGLTNNQYENGTSEAIAVAMASKIGVGFSNFRTIKQSTYVDTIGTPVFRREIFHNVGYFDEVLVRNQDDDLSYRIIKAGYKIWLCADISMKYHVRANLKNLFKQYFQYGYWKVYVNRKHKTITTYRQLAPAMLLLFIVFGYPVLAIIGLSFLYKMILLLYLLVVFITSIIIAPNKKMTFTIGAAIIILHVAYGSGYLTGMKDFLLINKGPSNKAKELTR